MGFGFVFIAIVVILICLVFRQRGQWNRTYVRLGTRYCGKSGRGGVVFGILFSRPSLTFDYGRTFCSLRNRKSFLFAGRKTTELAMVWADRRFRLELGTTPIRSPQWGASSMKPVVIEDPRFQSDYHVAASSPLAATRLLTGSVQWQIEQLRRFPNVDESSPGELQISIARGSLVVSKPGYIKKYEVLEDFVRLSLELFDQLMLVNAEGLEFLNQDQATVVKDVKCPICSEEIGGEMVVCTRCKTPHCKDCWQYNGQCATFACNETRCNSAGAVAAS